MRRSLARAWILGAVVLQGCSGQPEIAGKYTMHSNGARAEFLSDGTLIFITAEGRQGVWAWSKTDDGRLKLSPGPGMFGTRTTVCAYTLTTTELRLTGCDIADTFNRL